MKTLETKINDVCSGFAHDALSRAQTNSVAMTTDINSNTGFTEEMTSLEDVNKNGASIKNIDKCVVMFYVLTLFKRG